MAVAAAPAATKLTCKLTLTTAPPPGSNTVSQPPSQGTQYGPTHCPRAGFGAGIVADSFIVPDSGDIVGKYTQYFQAGSIKGSFDLAPQEGAPISPISFESQSWVGTLKITGGTGVYSAVKGVKGTGVFKCATDDSVHLACTEKIKITLG
jgi:hypothetical protein